MLDFILQHFKLLAAFLVGFLGSAAYLTTLYFKFVGDADSVRNILVSPFLNKEGAVSFSKVLFYCTIGGAVALVFQWDVPNFVAVQNLILGITWPLIVSQFLSGRMISPSKREIDEYGKALEPNERNAGAEMNEMLASLKKMPVSKK